MGIPVQTEHPRGRARLRWLGLTAVVLVTVALVVSLLLRTGDPPDGATAHAEPATSTEPSTTPAATSGATSLPTSSAPAALPDGITALTVAEPSHAETYDRARFTHWIDADRDCQDTRAEVLVVESRVPVTFTDADACTVATGEWLDPWSGRVDTSARALDVDHTVPLANAWRSGAWAWTDRQRQDFANDLADAPHLIAIPLGENRSKGDRGPESWRPPSPAAWCGYARAWTAIKARWNLTASATEWSALQTMAATC